LIQAAQKEVLDSYRKEFDWLATGFRDLDGKAQGTATVAGAFLAAGLALLNRGGGLKEVWSESILVLAVLGLIVAIVLSVQALKVRTILGCPSGEDVSGLLKRLQGRPAEELQERLLYFCGDIADLWRSCVTDRRNINERKARFIWAAQVSLTVSALCITSLIIGVVLLFR
jgi:hypothetical protein